MEENAKDDVGKRGEIIAANYLERSGYVIIETNFENKLGYRVGEIDIIARDPKSSELVFVEVKTRRKSRYSPPPELAVTRGKYQKLAKIISRYLNKNKLPDCDYRLDVIAVEMDTATKRARLRHLKYVYC